MNEMRRILALALCFVMLVGMLPAGALATDTQTTEPSETTAVTEATSAARETTLPAETESIPAESVEESVPATTVVTEPSVPQEENTAPEESVPEVTGETEVAGEDASAEETPAFLSLTRAGGSNTNADYLFIATDRHTNTSIIATMINAMESKIGENELDYLGLGGDMVGSGNNHPYYTSSTVLGEVTGATTSLVATNVDIVAGIHDVSCNDDAGILLPYTSEPAMIYEGDRFYIYGVPESAISGGDSYTYYTSSNSSTSGSYETDPEKLANNFVTWANGSGIDKSKAIIVLSHYPLHVRRNDNDGAVYWAAALNTVAAGDDATIDRNVAFFWGHNHTEESPADTAVYHVAPNGSISVQGGSSSQKIYFTYANAGYLNSHSSATLVTITDSTITFDKYKSSSVSTTNTVERVETETVTLTSLAVSGKTEYYVGDTFENPTVTAVYSDNSTKDITASVICSGYDMSTAGTQTVTVTWGEESTTYTITVEPNYVSSIAVTTQPTKVSYLTTDTALDTTGMVVTATYANDTTAAVTNYTLSDVDFTTAGEKTVTVTYTENGTAVSTTFTITVEEAPEALTLQSIEITTPPTKTEYLFSEELVLDGMVVTATFLNESNETVTQEIAYKPFSTSTVYGGYELDNFSMYVEKAHAMTVTYTYGEVTCTATTTINVWAEDFTDEETSVKVHVTGDYGVTGISVAESENTNVATAIASVISGSEYKAYDISLVFDADEDGNALYTETDATKTVTLPIPQGVSNPVVYYVPTEGDAQPVNITSKTTSTVTFETTHFSTYVIGESIEITVPENETAEGNITTGDKETKTVYMLTTSISTGNAYLIADTNTAGSANLLANSSGSVSNTTATVVSDSNGTYIVLDDATDELWTYDTVTSSENWGQSSTYYTFKNGSYYLYYTQSGSGKDRTYTLGLTTSTPSKSWSYSTSNNRLSITPGNTAYYLNGGSSWSMSSSTDSVYFYVATEIEVDTTVTVTGTYSIDGKDISAVVASDSSTTADLTSTLIFTPNDGTATSEDVSKTATYEIVTVDANENTVDGDPNDIITKIENGVVYFSGNYGTALVKVSYESSLGTVTDYITVEATAPYYTIELHYANLTEVASDATFDSTATYYVFNSTTNVYEKVEITAFADGVTYYTTPVVKGDEIDETIALKGIVAGDRYPIWAVVSEVTSDGATDLGDLGDALSWTVSDTSIAEIDPDTGVLTFTGENYGTFTVTVAYEGADGKVITDTITISATESLYVVPGDGTDDFPEYPNQGAVRFDKTATAVGNFSETGIAKVEISMTGVPYSTGSEIDVVVMLDITGSMKDVTNSSYSSSDDEYYTRIYSTVEATKAFARAIVINEDGSYNKNRIGIYSFNSAGTYTLHDLSAITDIDALDDEIETFINNYATGGTPYDDGLALVQSTLATAKTDGTGNDRQQFAVFMSDGVPTDYEYITGTTHANYSDADDIAAMLDSSDDYATRLSSGYYYEYYSTEMKADGVTVYTVGLGLNNTNSAWSGTATQCYNVASALLNDISGPANEASQPDQPGTSTKSKLGSYFFSVDDADAASQMGTVFSNIAQKIVEAAKDVVVEDKIGNNYSINFSLPSGVTSTDTDGLSEFYIQVVEYQLDSNKERTGDPYVKENITFTTDSSGNLRVKSHTIDGTSCGDSCTHVTITNNQVTAIDGTYFDYKRVDEDGVDAEYLTWNEDKITNTELALQYFAHLDNSSDAVGTDGEIAAGTYYTNEYATLTYTNYQGNQVQNEFPVPQMTWNGAQVSYTFYLVNEAGQPVNRAGRVVPFAEAVYVTDVFTYSIVWNSLEQSAGLEADYLAENLVPDAYALYDDDAEYFIHVYEDEEKDNLNNHFTIGGDVTDDYNTTTHSWTNANTTYVFNNKADATKYNTVGTYIASDGTTTAVTTYLCKGDGTVTATIEQVTVADATAFAAGTYFVLNSSGNYVQAAAYDASATYYAITSASYTAADGETQSKAADMESTSGATIIDDYLYYIDENNKVYTIVQKSNGTEVETGFDFHNTTVAFAVVWKPELKEDAVVVDYGLDVVIDVITNDNMAAGVVGVRTDKPDATINSGNYTAAKATSVDVSIDSMKIGTATVENLNSVRFSLDKTNGMQFTDPAVFYYEADVNYYDSNNALQSTSMYSSVTVIPATTVYYEDEYVTLKRYTDPVTITNEDGTTTTTYTEHEGWESNSASASAVQDTDRPGINKIAETYDADNNYGSDSAYETMSTYSMGSAAKITVDANTRGEATFTFYGTGFDVISMTSNTTGTLIIQVYSGAEASGTAKKSTVVDTYYGMDADGNISENNPEAIYQVPVMKISGLTYGQYTAKITAGWNDYFDHVEGSTSYDLYLDAIRIYDPTGNQNDTANEAYVADGEGWPTYVELRDNIIEASKYKVTENEDGTVTVTGDDLSGAIFIDCNDATTSIADYVSYGPNNELYLANGQAVAFNVTMDATVADVQLGIKMANGDPVTYEINGDSYTVNTATDMYYSILEYAKAGTVTIKNLSGGILSLTNIKVTHTEAPAQTSETSLLWMDAESAGTALMSLRPVVEEETPETTVPEETEPETTIPEETESEETEPETTVPEETEPEESKPTVEDPDEGTMVKEIINSIANMINSLFGWLFR